MATFKGNAPRDGVLLATLIDDDGSTWSLFDRPAAASGDWQSLKLCAVHRDKHKANYWLGWHRAERRMARVRSAAALREHRPALYDMVIVALGGFPEPEREPAPLEPEAPHQPAVIDRTRGPTPAQRCLMALHKIKTAHGDDVARKLLATFNGASTVADVPSERWPEVADMLEHWIHEQVDLHRDV